MDGPDFQLDGARVLEIIRERQPMVYDLAVQQALIEHQNAVIAALREQLSPDQVSSGQ